MFGAILKATNSSFQKGMTFCRSIYVKKAMKLLAFTFEQSSYLEGYTDRQKDRWKTRAVIYFDSLYHSNDLGKWLSKNRHYCANLF